jgi:uncharacterized protein YnzC (UPF0291/DUF896 family)
MQTQLNLLEDEAKKRPLSDEEIKEHNYLRQQLQAAALNQEVAKVEEEYKHYRPM